MANRDVNLVIRAKDQASRAFLQVGQALDEVLKATGAVAAGADRLDTALAKSQGGAQALARKFGEGFTQEFEQAALAFQRIENTVAQARATFEAQEQTLAGNREAYRALRAQVEAAEQAIVSAAIAARQSGDVSDVKRLEAAQTAYRELTREAAKVAPALAAQEREIGDNANQLRRLETTATAAALALRDVERARLRAQSVAANQPTAVANQNARKGIAELAAAERRVETAIRAREAATAQATEQYRKANDSARRGIGELAKQERILEAQVRARAAAQVNAQARVGFRTLGVEEAAIARQADLNAAAVEAQARAYALLDSRIRALQAAARPTTEQQERLATSFRRASVEADRMRGSFARGFQELLRLGQSADIAAGRFNSAAAEMTNMRRALAAFYGDSRRALSLMQRLRGEVLSLTASFVGFYGVFNVGRGFLDAFQSIEAATVRLQAVFEGDQVLAAEDLARLQSEANRLGISFNTLADNYSKFLISGQQAGIETDKLQTIFRQVTEAGRVLRLSNDQITGTLTALSQIAGKGTLQMEELRQQLGDRLPGAVGLVASALGYAEDELDKFYKAVENGQVGAEEALVALGKGLEEAYGGQLQNALDNVSARIGRLQNLFFQRQLTAANAGFIEGFEQALDALNNFLASDEGIEFFARLGAVMGDLLALIPGIIDNIDLLTIAFQGFVAIKLAQVASGFAGNLAVMGQAAVGTRQTILGLNATVFAFSPAAFAAMTSATRLGVVLRGLRAVAASLVVGLRSLFLSLGGPIGIAVAAASFFALDGLGGVDEAALELNKTLEDHTDLVNQVRTAYAEAADGAKDWKENLEDVTEVEVAARLEKLRRQLVEYRSDLANTLNTSRGNAPEVRVQLLDRARNQEERELIQSLLDADKAWNEARMSSQEYLEVIEQVYEIAPDLLPVEVLDRFRQFAQGGAEIERSIGEAEAILRLFNGTATEADKTLLRLPGAAQETADAQENAATKTSEFNAALRQLAEAVPSLKAELEKMDAVEKLATDFQNALTAARALPDAIMRIAAEQQALQRFQLGMDAIEAGSLPDGFASASSGAVAAAALLRQKEGFRETPYNDPRTDRNGNQIGPNVYRAGYGSDTVTLSDGSVQRVVQGMRVSVADANRDLLRRINTEFLPKARNQVGAARFDSFNPQQQAALVSIAYNYGSLPNRILDALRTGTNEQIADAIRGLSGDNGGVNAGRRRQEAAIFTQGVGNDAALDRALQAEEEAARAAEERAEAQRKYREQQEAGLDDLRFETEQENARLIDREVATALREAENKAAEVGLTLSAQERQEIEATVRARFAGAQAEEDKNAALERGRELQEEVSRLEERKAFLLDQADFQRETGDSAGLASTEAELASIETALDAAIEKAIAFWQAMGGPDAEAAITALQASQLELQRFGTVVVTTGEEINNLFADAATSAIDRFAKRVAEGENAVQAFGQEFLQMAGEILVQIAQMIIRQAIFNALAGAMGGGPGGGVGGVVAGGINAIFRHRGGLANGSGRSGRKLDPAIFANAVRYHGGGLAGLAPNEVPAILEKEEEILTRDNPRHILNGGGAGSSPAGGSTIINAFDGPGFLDAALSVAEGRKVILNYVRANKREFKAALEG